MRVMLIDDERLVRDGLKRTIPWAELDMEVVGEAFDGDSALQVLSTLPVDLLFVDISMPGMTGLELVSQVRAGWPEVQYVMLTCHQDFFFVQEALRLGALDYIVKTELETDLLKKNLRRIKDKVDTRAKSGVGAILEPVRSLTQAVFHLDLERTRSPLAKSDQPWGRLAAQGEEASAPNAGTIPLVLTSIPNLPSRTIVALVSKYIERQLYFDFRYTVSSLELEWREIERYRFDAAPESSALRAQVASLSFLFDGKALETFTKGIRAARPDLQELQAQLSVLVFVLGLFASDRVPPALVRKTESLRFWVDWEEWLQVLNSWITELSLSQTVLLRLMRALVAMATRSSEKLRQEDLAEEQHINRSYFSVCFKEFVGFSFVEMLTRIRMEQARDYLVSTNEPIYRIAEMVGFQDEKYFSRLFHKHTGLVPSQLRL